MSAVLSYSHGDIANWARFSGDYNPIHFDLDASRRFGHDAVVVHGMLAVLQALERVQQDLVAAEVANKWISVTQRLRVPIYPGEELELVVSPPSRARLVQRESRGVKVSVDVRTSNEFEGKAFAPHNDNATIHLSPIFVGADALRESFAALRADFSWLRSEVTLLQAAAFAYFMKLRIETLENWVKRRSQLDDGVGYTVVQTSHRALVHGAWFTDARLRSHLELQEGMRISFAPTVLTILEGRCACTCRIEVAVGGAPAFFSEVGLLLSHNSKEYQ